MTAQRPRSRCTSPQEVRWWPATPVVSATVSSARPAKAPSFTPTSCCLRSRTAEQKHGLHDPIEMQRAGSALPIEQIASRWIVASDPESAVAAIKPYLDYGFNHLVFHGPGHDQSRF